MSNIKQPETKFEVYEGETDGKVHEMPEVDDIPDLDLFLYVELFFPENGGYMQATKFIGRGTYHYGKPIDT